MYAHTIYTIHYIPPPWAGPFSRHDPSLSLVNKALACYAKPLTVQQS